MQLQELPELLLRNLGHWSNTSYKLLSGTIVPVTHTGWFRLQFLVQCPYAFVRLRTITEALSLKHDYGAGFVIDIQLVYMR